MTRSSHRSAKGPSQRQLRVAEEIRRTVHDILANAHWRDPLLAAAAVTVTSARISPDLKAATVYVVPLGGKDADAIIKALNAARAYVRGELGHALNHYRVVPDLRFERDVSFEEGAHIDRLLRSDAVRRDLGPARDDGDA